MTTKSDPALSEEALATIQLLQRNGMRDFELRFSLSEQKNGYTVWMAIATFADRWEVTAARKPSTAVLRLGAEVVDGSVCNHCGKICGFDEDYMHTTANEMTAPIVCWFIFDPELKTFRRGCEGD